MHANIDDPSAGSTGCIAVVFAQWPDTKGYRPGTWSTTLHLQDGSTRTESGTVYPP